MKYIKVKAVGVISFLCLFLWTTDFLAYGKFGEKALSKARDLIHSGQFKKCVSLVDRQLRHSELETNLSCDALILKATALQQLGLYPAAYKTLQQMVPDIFDCNPAQQVNIHLQLSDLYLSVGRISKAVKHSEKATNLARVLEKPALVAKALHNSANILMVKSGAGEPFFDHLETRSEAIPEERLLIAKRGHSRGGRMVVRGSNPAQIKKAINFYTESANSAFVSGIPTTAVRSMINRAKAGLSIRDFTGAVESIEIADKFLTNLPQTFEKGFLTLSLGVISHSLSNHRSLPQGLHSPLTAWRYFTTAVAIGEALKSPYLLSWGKGYLGNLYEQKKRVNEAMELTRSAIFFAEQSDRPEILYRWQWQMGRLLETSGRRQEAIQMYGQAVETLAPIRQALTVGYRKAPNIFAERIKPLYYELAELYVKNAGSIAQTEGRVVELRQAQETIELMKSAELQDYFQDDCVSAFKAKAVQLDKLQVHDVAVVYPIFLKNQFVTLITLPEGLDYAVSTVDPAELDQLIRSYRLNLEDEENIYYLEESKQLYDLIFKPIETRLRSANINTLIVVPDGALTLVPFSTLFDGKKFLIEKYAVVTTPGLTLTDPQPLDRTEVESILFGLSDSVSFEDQEYPELSNVTTEILAIQDMLGSKVIQNEEFDKDRVTSELKRANYGIIHVATHGEFDENPEKTMLLTHKDKISLNDLEALIKFSKFREQPLELLTLSACRTAAGDERAALGLAGVAVKSGARSALASLWYIDDKATMILVKEFYRQYFKVGGMTKARALQNAQKKLLASPTLSHPSKWAPFLLIGNWL